MRIRNNLWRLSMGGAALLVVGAIIAAVLMSNPSGGTARTRDHAGPAGEGRTQATTARSAASPTVPPPAADPSLSVTLDPDGPGQAIPSGFLGFSFEFQAVRAYTGDDPEHIDPVLVQLIRNLTPGQAPVLRIGGDSTDASYAPAPGVRPPAYVDYPLTPSWMATTAALAHTLGARMIMGLNLAADQPALAAAEARDFAKALGAGSIEALEIGNEPNVYSKNTVLHTVFGVSVEARAHTYAYPDYRSQFDAIAAAAPPLALAGPALAIGPTPGPGSWLHSMSGFLSHQPRVALMTVHRYPLRNCDVPPSSPQYPSIAHLLSSYATVGLASSLRRWVTIAHREHRPLRVDELNSVACRGKAGVSDTFASALWVTDALFSLAHAGVDGIDMHTLPGAAYQLFQFSDPGGRWEAQVRPVYYGLQLFAQAAPAGSQIVAVGRHGHAPSVSTWATRAPDGTIRVVLINKSQTAGQTIAIDVPGSKRASVERMLAPSVSAGSGITLGGRSYGAETGTGVLPRPRTHTVTATATGSVKVSLPHGSAALLTFHAR